VPFTRYVSLSKVLAPLAVKDTTKCASVGFTGALNDEKYTHVF